MLKQSTLELLDAVDSESAVPGGGSVSALVGAFGVCLARMYGHLTVNKKRFLTLDESQQAIFKAGFDGLIQYKKQLSKAVLKDCEAYDAVMSAYKLPKNSDEEKTKRHATILEATLSAIESPYSIMQESLKAMRLCEQMIENGNQNAVSDLACGVILLDAAIQGAGLNVQINLASLTDAEKTHWSEKMQKTLDESHILKETIVNRIKASI